jgi:hypothetical protein
MTVGLVLAALVIHSSTTVATARLAVVYGSARSARLPVVVGSALTLDGAGTNNSRDQLVAWAACSMSLTKHAE